MGANPSRILDPDRLSGAEWFQLPSLSGVLSSVAAGGASAGHLYALRYLDPLSTGRKFHLTQLVMQWQTRTPPTTEQEIGFSAFKLTGYSAAHAGGVAIAAQPLSSEYDTDMSANLTARRGDTGALTAGTHTIAAEPFLHCAFQELAATATLQRGFAEAQDDCFDPHPLVVLGHQEGILVRNDVAMGASLSGRLFVRARGYYR